MRQIALSQDKITLVDDEDYEQLNKYKWYAHQNRGRWYAQCLKQGVMMHNEILNPPSNYEIDHKNGDGLDNRRSNLRICTHKQNMQNRLPNKTSSSKHKGVSWKRGRIYKGKQYNGKWRARIMYNDKNIHLGSFDSEIEAAKAYDEAAKKLFGEFARTNFI